MKFFLSLLIAFNSSSLFANPWDLSSDQYKSLHEHIISTVAKNKEEAKAKGLTTILIDLETLYLNMESECPHCKNKEFDLALQKELETQGFILRSEVKKFFGGGHCGGITGFFVKYLSAHPELLCESNQNLIKTVISDPNYLQEVHRIQINQPASYKDIYSSKFIWQSPQRCIEFYKILMDLEPSFHFGALNRKYDSDITDAQIYATLKHFENKYFIISIDDGAKNHSILISSHQKKNFILDSNWGMTTFPDLETLSYFLSIHLKNNIIYKITVY